MQETEWPQTEIVGESYSSLMTQPEKLDMDEVIPYIRDPSHRKYLDNPAYHEYLSMKKTAVMVGDTDDLLNLAEELAEQYMPRYIDAAAWSFAEVGMVDVTRSATERCELISKAEDLWRSSATRESSLQQQGFSLDGPDAVYRSITPLIYAPLMKSIAIGTVTESTRKRALESTIDVATQVAAEIDDYSHGGDRGAVSGLLGVAHELNALAMLLYMDDPRYVPMPATARADSGYYHRSQTHDIIVINQHWGDIKKIVPVEVKARTTGRDRRRYEALLVRGKMHLSASGGDPRDTIRAFDAIRCGKGNPQDTASIERMATELRTMLNLYNKGSQVGGAAVRSVMQFYSSPALYEAYPEISPKSPKA